MLERISLINCHSLLVDDGRISQIDQVGYKMSRIIYFSLTRSCSVCRCRQSSVCLSAMHFWL